MGGKLPVWKVIQKDLFALKLRVGKQSVFSERKYSVRDDNDSLIGQDMHSINMPAMPIKQAFCEK